MASQVELGTTTQTIKLQEGEIALLSAKLLESTAAHQQLVEDLNITKARIKNLTGIRIKVVQQLKEKLGRKINIDPNSGAIRLPSSVLFAVALVNTCCILLSLYFSPPAPSKIYFEGL